MAYYDINGKEITLSPTQKATTMLGTRMIWDSSLNNGQGGSAGVWYDTPQTAQQTNQRYVDYDNAVGAMQQRAAGQQAPQITAGPQQTAPTAQAVAQQTVPVQTASKVGGLQDYFPNQSGGLLDTMDATTGQDDVIKYGGLKHDQMMRPQIATNVDPKGNPMNPYGQPRQNMMMRPPMGLLGNPYQQSFAMNPQRFQQMPTMNYQMRPFGQYSAWGQPQRFGQYQPGGWNQNFISQNLGFGYNPFRGY